MLRNWLLIGQQVIKPCFCVTERVPFLQAKWPSNDHKYGCRSFGYSNLLRKLGYHWWEPTSSTFSFWEKMFRTNVHVLFSISSECHISWKTWNYIWCSSVHHVTGLGPFKKARRFIDFFLKKEERWLPRAAILKIQCWCLVQIWSNFNPLKVKHNLIWKNEQIVNTTYVWTNIHSTEA